MSDSDRDFVLEFMRANRVSAVATVDGQQPVVRLMQTARIDDDFTCWFATGADSNKVRHLAANPHICLLYYAGETDVRVRGRVERITDQALRDELWEEDWKQYFSEGSTDPNYALLKTIPEQVEFRDTKRTNWEIRHML